MPSASAGVSELLHAKLDALLAAFDTVAARVAFGETTTISMPSFSSQDVHSSKKSSSKNSKNASPIKNTLKKPH